MRLFLVDAAVEASSPGASPTSAAFIFSLFIESQKEIATKRVVETSEKLCHTSDQTARLPERKKKTSLVRDMAETKAKTMSELRSLLFTGHLWGKNCAQGRNPHFIYRHYPRHGHDRAHGRDHDRVQ